jgi:uncharacterized damage-inducible protein DinB
MSLTQTLSKLFERDIELVKQELLAYTYESLLWKTAGSISNSPGNLTLHLAGNLQHFIGAQLGNSGYIRQRDLEFSQKDIPREHIIDLLDTAKKVVAETLARLTDDDLRKDYPLVVFGKTETTEYFLVHLVAHLNYHLGQINYHRRLVQ